MELTAEINGVEITTGSREGSKLTWGIENPRTRADLTVLEGGLLIVGESAVGDAFGVRASVGATLEVFDAGTKIFRGYVVDRQKAVINQTDPPWLVEISAMDWAWRLRHPPAHVTKVYQATSQTDKAIIEDALELAGFGVDGLADLAVDTSLVTARLSPVPPISFENATPWDVLDQLALLSGAKWYARPDLKLVYDLQRYFKTAPFEVVETF